MCLVGTLLTVRLEIESNDAARVRVLRSKERQTWQGRGILLEIPASKPKALRCLGLPRSRRTRKAPTSHPWHVSRGHSKDRQNVLTYVDATVNIYRLINS